MYVRKFEADTLDDALKMIKSELGPDAIILKTQTNKGLKGAFKKKKIEITAAISERSYEKKANVDRVLDSDLKSKFYNSSSSYINNILDDYDQTSNKSKNNSYENMAINRPVQRTNKQKTVDKSSALDIFLKGNPTQENKKDLSVPMNNTKLNESLLQQKRIEELETQLAHISDYIQTIESKYSQKNNEEKQKEIINIPNALMILADSLRSFDIGEHSIQRILKKARFELTVDELEDEEIVFELALREMQNDIRCQMPLFSSVESGPVVTVLVSEAGSGQTSMLLKLGALKTDSVLIQYDGELTEKRVTFAEKFFHMKVEKCNSIGEVVSQGRKAVDANKSVIIDFRGIIKNQDQTKKFIDGLHRSFAHVEILVCLSALHTENYNKKALNRFRSLANGIVLSHLDLCTNFGQLYNLATLAEDLPYKFYGTGCAIPDDLEGATAERILAGIFQLNES